MGNMKWAFFILFLLFYFSCADSSQTELLINRIQTVKPGMTPKNATEIMIIEPKQEFVYIDGGFGWHYEEPPAFTSSPICIYFTKDSVVEYVTWGL